MKTKFKILSNLSKTVVTLKFKIYSFGFFLFELIIDFFIVQISIGKRKEDHAKVGTRKRRLRNNKMYFRFGIFNREMK